MKKKIQAQGALDRIEDIEMDLFCEVGSSTRDLIDEYVKLKLEVQLEEIKSKNPALIWD